MEEKEEATGIGREVSLLTLFIIVLIEWATFLMNSERLELRALQASYAGRRRRIWLSLAQRRGEKS